jgi:hypothetical protein
MYPRPRTTIQSSSELHCLRGCLVGKRYFLASIRAELCRILDIDFREPLGLLKKSALSWWRPLIGLETPQKRRIWCPIWGESVHRGSFSTGWPLLRLSEKGTSNASRVDLPGIRRAKWTENLLFGGPQGYATSVSKAFRTVSLRALVNKPPAVRRTQRGGIMAVGERNILPGPRIDR